MTDRVVTMSQKEIDRLEIIQRVMSKQIRQERAAELLGLSSRQVRNLQIRYQQFGAEGLISRRRGKRGNNRLPEAVKAEAIELVKRRYHDFGPTFAHEKLTEQHGLALSIESLRQLMIEADIWQGKKRKKVRVHQMRTRRSALGELVQIDGSPHDWFEGRRPKCCLLVFIDDATSRIMHCHFTEVECTEAYFAATEGYLLAHGRPLSYYSDKHGIFRVNQPEAKSGTGETQFGRALRELDIELICANSPQAKGRVEKANATLQDRLIKEMRLREISTIPAANEFLPEFIADYNKRFAVEAASDVDAHRQSLPEAAALKLILCEHHERKLSKNLELSYNNIIYQIQRKMPSYTMRGAAVQVCDRSGIITLIYKGEMLEYKIFDKQNRPNKIVDSKALAVLKPSKPNKPKATHPWRQYERVAERKAQLGARQ